MDIIVKLVKCEEHTTKKNKSLFWDLAFEVEKDEVTHYFPVTIFHNQINFAADGRDAAIVYAVRTNLTHLLASMFAGQPFEGTTVIEPNVDDDNEDEEVSNQ